MLISFLASDILPRFRYERVHNYKKILQQFSKMERMNSKNIIVMWQSIMRFHSEKASEQSTIEASPPTDDMDYVQQIFAQ